MDRYLRITFRLLADVFLTYLYFFLATLRSRVYLKADNSFCSRVARAVNNRCYALILIKRSNNLISIILEYNLLTISGNDS